METLEVKIEFNKDLDGLSAPPEVVGERLAVVVHEVVHERRVERVPNLRRLSWVAKKGLS